MKNYEMQPRNQGKADPGKAEKGIKCILKVIH
jgi:hypothetical protein